MTNIFVENANYKQDRNPNLAPLLSLVPGLGQIYNGQARKGVLFLATATSYLSVFILIVFNQAIRSALLNFGQSVHMQPDQGLIRALSDFQFGSSLSLIVFLLYACFVLYAMRDAFDQAALQQRKYIYADCALEINEAASGSYLLHFASICLLFILAVFFFKHSPAPVQITNIVFEPTQIPTQRTVKTNIRSTVKAPNSGIHQQRPVTAGAKPNVAKSKAENLQAKANNFVPKINPILNRSVQKPLTPIKPNQLVQKTAVPPAPNLSMPKSATTTPNMPVPQKLNKQVDLPRPSSSSNSKASTNIIPLPLPGNLAAKSNVGDSTLPSPVSPSRSSFVPTPGSDTSPASTRSSARSTDMVKPLKSSMLPGGTLGIKGPIVRPVISSPTGGPSGPGTGKDGTLGNPPETSRTKEPASVGALPWDIAGYMGDLQRRIKQAWFPPRAPETKVVELIFKIHRGGELSDLHISKSSGVAAVDEAAMKAVGNAAPFRSLPKNAPDVVDIQFTFDYSVFGGKTSIYRRF